MTDSFFKDSTESDKNPVTIPELENSKEDGAKTEYAYTGAFQSEEGRLAAILSYIPLLCFIPLLNMRENHEARFHARQGVLLFLIELIAVLFLIDGISDFVFKAILVGAVVLSVVGIYFALQGKNYKLPVIGDIADKSKL